MLAQISQARLGWEREQKVRAAVKCRSEGGVGKSGSGAPFEGARKTCRLGWDGKGDRGCVPGAMVLLVGGFGTEATRFMESLINQGEQEHVPPRLCAHRPPNIAGAEASLDVDTCRT